MLEKIDYKSAQEKLGKAQTMQSQKRIRNKNPSINKYHST